MSWTQIKPILTSAALPLDSSLAAGSSAGLSVLSSSEPPQAARLSAMTSVSSSARTVSYTHLIQELNRDPQVDGILCQLPLPGHLDEEAVLNAIARDKDVDCFHPYNVGRLMIGDPVFLPCTPAGVMEMLREYGIQMCIRDRSTPASAAPLR